MSKITANTIFKALLNRHHMDLCVPECKTGPTQCGPKLLIMDLWVMRKSWVDPLTICYEIKVSRSDFLNDGKWRGYLDYCSDFYFAAPPGIIQPTELPPEAGLLVIATTGTRLFCKKKTVRRDTLIPESLWRYILMARTDIRTEYIENKKIYWEAWLKKKQIDRDFGYMVSKAIRETIKTEIEKVSSKNRELQHENENLKEIKRELEKLGFDKGISHWEFERKYKALLREIETGIPEGFEQHLAGAITNLQKVQEIVKERQQQVKLAL